MSCRIAVLVVITIIGFAIAPSNSRGQTNEQRSLVLIVGAPGEPEYAEKFTEWAGLWKQAAAQGGLQATVVGQDAPGAEDDHSRLLKILADEIARPAGELWLVFIGHGTYDGHTAKFNLRGPNISSDDLAAALKPCRRPLAIVQCASASGPFLPALSGPGRVIITATRSGYEDNATHFGGFLAHDIASPSADLDKDGQTSLLEAYLLASRQVAQYYKDQGLLMSEHALLDDNGDSLGTPADWFHGIRAVKSAAEGKSVDGLRANQMILVRGESEQKLSPETRARRDELERELSALRDRKSSMKEDDYYSQLNALMLQTARLYESDQSTKKSLKVPESP
jgi:hypothetical protein